MYRVLDALLGVVVPGMVVATAYGVGWLHRGAIEARRAERRRARVGGRKRPPSRDRNWSGEAAPRVRNAKIRSSRTMHTS